MNIRLIKLSAILVLSMMASGCMWSRVKINDPTIADRAAGIRIGETRGADVPRILNAQPTMRMPGKTVHTYGYTYGETKSNGLVLILFNFSRSCVLADTLYVEIDPATDIVKRVYIPPKRELEWRFWPFGD